MSTDSASPRSNVTPDPLIAAKHFNAGSTDPTVEPPIRDWSLDSQEFLQKVRQEIDHNGEYVIATINLLDCFGQQRRTPKMVQKIHDLLHQNDLQVTPSLEKADYYGDVVITTLEDQTRRSKYDTYHSDSTAAESDDDWVLSALKSDAEELQFLTYGMTVNEAITKMKVNGRSKLPLFFSASDMSTLIGTVTIFDLTTDAVGSHSNLTEKATTQVPVVHTNEKLFDWIPAILSYGFIYGKNRKEEIVQIYTVHDVAVYLNSITALFLRVNEIGELLKSVLRTVPEEEIAKAKGSYKKLHEVPISESSDDPEFLKDYEIAPRDSTDHDTALSDRLVFSDYIKVIGHPDIWEHYFKGRIPAITSKQDCIRTLNFTRLVRNQIMHFNHSDSLAMKAPVLESLAVWLRRLKEQIEHE